MRTIKTYAKRAPFYNAFVDTNPTDEPITSGLPVTRSQTQVVFQGAMKISQISKTKAAGENFHKSAEL